MIWTTIDLSLLCFIAKILVKLVLSKDSSYLNSQSLQYFSVSISSWPQHLISSSESCHDLLLSLSSGSMSMLTLLQFSSEFDTIDHPFIVHRIHADFGFTDTVLQWFSSYLTDRTQYISLSNHCSAFAPVHLGVPQGSFLGPYFSQFMLNLCLPFMIHTLSRTIFW